MYSVYATVRSAAAALAMTAGLGALAGVAAQETTVAAAAFGESRSPVRAHAPDWLQAGRAEALIAALRDAPSHALPAGRYDPDMLDQTVAAARADAGRRTLAETLLTRAYLDYARDVSSGILEPRDVAALIKVDPWRPDPARLLRDAAQARDMAAYLAGLPPSDPEYAKLREAYAAAAAEAARTELSPPVPPGPTLRVGDRGQRVVAVRRRLEEKGHGATASDPARFDQALAAAVRDFQAASGLTTDGLVGPATLSALNADARQRLGRIAVNLERMRWMNRPLGARHVVVNIPDYSVTLIDRGEVLFHERTVVGRLQEQTPEFSDEMEYLVFNPTWHVPRSIATRDILPKLQEDPTVLAQRNMRLVPTGGEAVPADPSLHDWTDYSASDFPFRIKQRPSAGNALGLVKFMFPNGDNIYLHDTPDKHLFDRDRRAYSWGCVRVRNPMRFAALLLEPQRSEPAAFIDGLLARGSEAYVNLDAHVPVHLIYRTTFFEKGRLQLRDDVYGRDALVLDALRSAGVRTPLG